MERRAGNWGKGFGLLCYFVIGIILLLSMLVLFSMDGRGATVVVDQSGEGDFSSVQEAIDGVEEGYTIRVRSGVYREKIVIDKKLTMSGDGIGSTVLDGNGTGDVVRILAPGVMFMDVTITGSGNKFPDYGAGMRIRSDSGTIFRVECTGNAYGIVIEECNLTSIRNSVITSNKRDGIKIVLAHGTIISGNNIQGNGDSGVNTISSDDVKISKNSLMTTMDETIIHPGRGIILVGSQEASMSQNILENTGIEIISDELSDWTTHFIDTTNLINDRPVRYYQQRTGMTITMDTGLLILAGCTDMIVNGLTVNDTRIGILVGFSTNITIEDTTCRNTTYGIWLQDSSGCTIAGNEVFRSERVGLFMDSCFLTVVRNNLFTLNGAQINSSSESGIGINLKESLNSRIYDNEVVRNSKAGMVLEHSPWNIIQNNNVSSNFGAGIRLEFGSSSNYLQYNVALFNRNEGLVVDTGSNGNLILDELYSQNDKGISIRSSDTLLIGSTNITGNIVGLQVLNDVGNVTLRWCVIVDNVYGILVNSSSGEVDAANNSWGSNSGPWNRNSNPEGDGNYIDDNVVFDPWLDLNGEQKYLHPDQEGGDGGKEWRIFDDHMLIAGGILILFLVWLTSPVPRRIRNH